MWTSCAIGKQVSKHENINDVTSFNMYVVYLPA